MKHSNILSALIFVICFFIAGCNSAESPEPTAEIPQNTAAAQIGVRPTQTPTPMPTATVTVTPEPTPTSQVETVTATITVTPRPTYVQSSELPLTNHDAPPPPTPTPSITPTPLPTVYPGDWVSGLIEDTANRTFEVGNGSMELFDGYITYETMDQATADMIAGISSMTLTVLFGEYTENTSEGEFDGHMIVKFVQTVHIPYSVDTPFSAVYVHPANLFSFAYPENWQFSASDNGNSIGLDNRIPRAYSYDGPGREGVDPTAISLHISVVNQSLDEYIQYHLERERVGEDVPQEEIRDIIVSELEINGLLITLIDEENHMWWPDSHYYVVPLNDETLLVFSVDIGTNFVERLISTLELSGN